MRHFKREEFNCKETGENEMSEHFLHRLDELRHRCKFPFVIVSGYRSEKHSLEKAKPSPGSHTRGVAADIVARGPFMRKLVSEAIRMGFTGIGINNGTVHIDDDTRKQDTMWGY